MDTKDVQIRLPEAYRTAIPSHSGPRRMGFGHVCRAFLYSSAVCGIPSPWPGAKVPAIRLVCFLATSKKCVFEQRDSAESGLCFRELTKTLPSLPQGKL